MQARKLIWNSPGRLKGRDFIFASCCYDEVMRIIRPLTVLLAVVPLTCVSAADSYQNFESHQFRPLTMSPSGDRLFVTNTPDNRVEIFELTNDGPRHVGDVMVGLEPVAIAARSDSEIWVVNHLSDSVSIIDLDSSPPQIKRTLYVGDEPRDIVFAGDNNQRAFITAAHRGQNGPYQKLTNPGELTTPGIGRADVWVFDAADQGEAPGGKPITILSLFGDSPGPLAVSPDGAKVYAGVFKSGNQTTIVGRVLICKGGADAEPCETMRDGPVAPGGLPAPNESAEGIPMPGAGLIVKWDGVGWKDELDRDWSDVIRLELPDYDVFELDAMATPVHESRSFASVGTILYALTINPANGKLYVANTDAHNEVRFEGEQKSTRPFTTVQGNLHRTRITIVDPESGTIDARHLNPHIDYKEFPASLKVREKSLSMPVGLAFTSNGKTLYVAAKGSDKIAVINARKLDAGRYRPSKKHHINVPGGGPAGLVLDEARGRLYVLTRFDNSLVVINTRKREIEQHFPLFNPEPDLVTAGRPLFYNAFLTSSNGESSCASCHVAGDKDELAWDLGDPLGGMLENPGKVLGPLRGKPGFHPMKGPMLTQTMRGIDRHGPLHWRGDRTAGNDSGGDPNDTEGAMKKFNAAFVSLMGREQPLSPERLQALTDFSLSMVPPPNPIRALNNSLNPIQRKGEEFFKTARSVTGGASCATCHVLNESRGWYGTSGMLTHIIGGRLTKVPHHRNTYERVGMFGRAPSASLTRDGEHMGPQVRGYGFTHDGGADTTIRFMSYPAFSFPEGDLQRRAVEQYLFAYESNLKPIVGQQITLSAASSRMHFKRAGLLIDRALFRDADIIARVVVDGVARGYLARSDGLFESDRSGETVLDINVLLSTTLSAEQTLTLTAVPLGSGRRMALDRNENGILDGDESSATPLSASR